MSGLDARRIVLPPTLRLLASTWRYRVHATDDIRAALDQRLPAVYAFWHGQMFPIWHWFGRLRPTAVVSASRDGEVLARYLSRIGYRGVVRGSSSRGGGEALREAVNALESGPILITPDGPRGPDRAAKPGCVVAALRAGVPLVLCGWSASRSHTFRSWDSMAIPWPLAIIDLRLTRFDLGDRGADGFVDPALLDELTRVLTITSSAT